MRIAAGIFGIAGLSYLGWDAWLTVTHGLRVGTWLMAVCALALLFQAYGLVRVTKHSRLAGLISATFIAGAAAIITSRFALPNFPSSLYTLPPEVWPMRNVSML